MQASEMPPSPEWQTSYLFVLYDAGETNALMPVMQKLENQGIDFKVLVMSTAETLVKPEMFKAHRLILNDFDVNEKVDAFIWQREDKLERESIKRICSKITAQSIIVGTVSRVQRQILKNFKGSKIAFCDQFDYDKLQTSFRTVDKTQKVAQIVLCPSKNLVNFFLSDVPPEDRSEIANKYKISGKPTLENWAKEIEAVDQGAVLEMLGFEKTKGQVITFVGGYGSGYEVMNPCFEEAATMLQSEGYQVLIQPHPKVAPQRVKTSEALAISDYVVGFNSSVIFDAAVIGKNSIYFYPDSVQFNHFAIREGHLPRVKSCSELIQAIIAFQGLPVLNLSEIEQIPLDSTDRIFKILQETLSTSDK